jgi:hypothetical protein
MARNQVHLEHTEQLTLVLYPTRVPYWRYHSTNRYPRPQDMFKCVSTRSNHRTMETLFLSGAGHCVTSMLDQIRPHLGKHMRSLVLSVMNRVAEMDPMVFGKTAAVNFVRGPFIFLFILTCGLGVETFGRGAGVAWSRRRLPHGRGADYAIYGQRGVSNRKKSGSN